MANPFVHIELQTKDVAKAKDFYGKLFDWTLEDIPMPDGNGAYTMIKVGEGTGGGMFTNPDPNVPPMWLAYVGVDDIVASTNKAQELGATIAQDVMEVGSYGWLSVIIDPHWRGLRHVETEADVIMDAVTLHRSSRKTAAGKCLRYTIQPSTLGPLLIAATPKGVCAIAFGDTERALADYLHEHFPRAQFESPDEEFRNWVSKLLRYIEQPQGVLDIPVDIHGTAFQRRVWKALQAIPSGQTASYSEIARRIRQPTAYRAVAHAIAVNPLAVAIPCHRAIRADGELAGYRWGVARKAELLRRESGE